MFVVRGLIYLIVITGGLQFEWGVKYIWQSMIIDLSRCVFLRNTFHLMNTVMTCFHTVWSSGFHSTYMRVIEVNEKIVYMNVLRKILRLYHYSVTFRAILFCYCFLTNCLLCNTQHFASLLLLWLCWKKNTILGMLSTPLLHKLCTHSVVANKHTDQNKRAHWGIDLK